MSGTRNGLAKRSMRSGLSTRMAQLLPLCALFLVLAVAAWLAIDHDRELSRTETQQNQSIRDDFEIGLAGTHEHVEREIDRTSELIRGIVAFASTSPVSPWSSVDTYLELTGAEERFTGLVDATVHMSEANTSSFLEPPPQPQGSEFAQLIAEVDAEVLANPQVDPILSSHQLRGNSVVAITFRLTDWRNPPLASLIFDERSFLKGALTPAAQITVDLTNTGERTDLSEAYEAGDTIPTLEQPNGNLGAQINIDVFGTEFLLTGTSTRNGYTPAGHADAWIMLIAGGAAALGIYVALRSLLSSRANALESAKSADQRSAAVDLRFKASFELAPIGMAEVDAAGRLVEVNEALCKQTGRHHDTIVGRPLSSLVYEGDRDAHISRVESLLDGTNDAVQGEHRFRHRDGGDVWVHESISVIGTDDLGNRSLLVQSQDITAQRRASWELAQQALHDELTGLPNRALFLNRLKHALIRAGRHDTKVAVMFIDVDRFKVINDSLGHEMGDRFLMEISERIGQAIRSGDTVARFGGDEFVVLCEAVSGESEATAAAQRIQSAFAAPFKLGDSPTYATASIGITLSTGEESSADELLRDADAAMYRAKECGRNRAELFDHSMRSTIIARMEIESQLRAALQNGEIVMHYQAIVDPDTHQPAGYEALIRWNHPDKGLLGPAAFLEVAEEAGLIHLIDSFALRTACQQIARWVREFPAARNLYLTTNWSARHLGRFVQQVEQVLAETGINPQQLVIEVTEGFLLEDSDASVLALQQLKQLGVQIAIDDFGTGYSSLAYLTQFAVDYLKIDRSFVSKLPDDAASAAVIGAIADMATRLGIKLVAEGVETDEQIEMLATLGSPRLQGYRFAKPRPADDIERQLAERSGLAESVLRDAEHLLASPVGAH